MARPRDPNKQVPITFRLPPEAAAEIDRRAEKRGQTRGDWLRDQLTKALLRPEPVGQQAQASPTLATRNDRARVATATARAIADVEPRWKERDAPKAKPPR